MTAPLMAETGLLCRLRTGDEDAYTQFVRQYTGRMLSLARGFLHSEDDAADAVQDAFLSAFKSLGRFEGNSSLRTWLHRIAVNTFLMRIRSKSRRKTHSIEKLLPAFDKTCHHAQPVAPCPRTGMSAWPTVKRKPLSASASIGCPRSIEGLWNCVTSRNSAPQKPPQYLALTRERSRPGCIGPGRRCELR